MENHAIRLAVAVLVACGCESSASQPATDAKGSRNEAAARGSWNGDTGTCSFGPDVLALPPASGACDPASCAAAKGTCVWGGIGCATVCALQTTDIGKACSDKAECQGFCETTKETAARAPARGTCSRTMMQTGCANRVVKDVAQGYTCVD